MAGTAMATPPATESKPARKEPLEFLDAIQEEMARLWDRPWPWAMTWPMRQMAPMSTTAWAPKMDVFEKNGDLVVKAELPGVN